MISEAFSQFRKDIIENLSFSGVLFWFVFLPIILILLSLAYEDLTNSFFLSKMERKAALLKQLYELERQGITESHNLNAIYDRTMAELNSYEVERPALFRFLTHKLTIAFGAGMPLGLLITLAVVFTRSKKDRTGSKMASAFGIGIALVGGAIALVITAFSNPLIGVAVIVAIQAACVLYVVGYVVRQTMLDFRAKKESARNSLTAGRRK
jgi:hypothetical protein